MVKFIEIEDTLGYRRLINLSQVANMAQDHGDGKGWFLNGPSQWSIMVAKPTYEEVRELLDVKGL